MRRLPAASGSANSNTKPRWRKAIENFVARLPGDEWDAIALSYTSGTTGNPKGVVTHHRGAYLNAVSNILAGGLGQHPVYLWTLPMFHCNGWCFPWTIAAVGRHQCLPAQGRSGQDLRADQGARRHPHVRRADRLQHADQRAGCAEGQGGAAGGRTDRGRGTAGGGARRRRKHRHQADACLRPDRGLWPRLGLRRAAGLGRTAGRPARATEAPAGRALPAAGSRHRDRSRDHAAKCRATARPSARSCSAAIS